MAVAVLTMTGAPAPLRAQQQATVQTTERLPALPALTGLRFVAALAVVMVHFGSRLVPAGPLRQIAQGGGVGVSLFFILSGFILTYSYAGPDGRLRGSRRGFYVARFARCYPVYLLGLLAGLGPALWAPGPNALHVGAPLAGLLALTLTQSWLAPASGLLDAPAWSLSAEAFFYALFPALLCAVRGLTLRRRGCLALLGGAWLAGLVGPLLYLVLRPDGAQGPGVWFDITVYTPLLRLPQFVLGVALGRLFLLNQGQGPLTRRWAGPLAVLAAGLVPVALLLRPVLLWDEALLGPLFALLIYALAASHSSGPLGWLLSIPGAGRLGTASFALYLLHVPLWDWLGHVRPDLAAAPTPAYFLVYLGAAIGLGLLVHAGLEEPARRALQRVLGDGAQRQRRSQLAHAPQRHDGVGHQIPRTAQDGHLVDGGGAGPRRGGHAGGDRVGAGAVLEVIGPPHGLVPGGARVVEDPQFAPAGVVGRHAGRRGAATVVLGRALRLVARPRRRRAGVVALVGIIGARVAVEAAPHVAARARVVAAHQPGHDEVPITAADRRKIDVGRGAAGDGLGQLDPVARAGRRRPLDAGALRAVRGEDLRVAAHAQARGAGPVHDQVALGRRGVRKAAGRRGPLQARAGRAVRGEHLRIAAHAQPAVRAAAAREHVTLSR